MFEKISWFWITIGLLIGGFGTQIFLQSDFYHDTFHVEDHFHTHADDTVHYHADMLIMLNGNRLDLTDERYMSAQNQILHDGVHLHDEDDTVIHFHAEGISLGTFFDSIGLSITNDCLSLDTSETYCTDETKSLLLFVNGELIAEKATFIPQDEDRILVYYGSPDDEMITVAIENVTADACIYSLTCPEKGVPPPESCGLTCEI